MEKIKNTLLMLGFITILITLINLADRALVIEDDNYYKIGYDNFKRADYDRQVLLLSPVIKQAHELKGLK